MPSPLKYGPGTYIHQIVPTLLLDFISFFRDALLTYKNAAIVVRTSKKCPGEEGEVYVCMYVCAVHVRMCACLCKG